MFHNWHLVGSKIIFPNNAQPGSHGNKYTTHDCFGRALDSVETNRQVRRRQSYTIPTKVCPNHTYLGLYESEDGSLFISFSSSTFLLTLHTPPSSKVKLKIILTIFLSKISSLSISCFVNVHASHPCATIGLFTNLYILSLTCLWSIL